MVTYARVPQGRVSHLPENARLGILAPDLEAPVPSIEHRRLSPMVVATVTTDPIMIVAVIDSDDAVPRSRHGMRKRDRVSYSKKTARAVCGETGWARNSYPLDSRHEEVSIPRAQMHV